MDQVLLPPWVGVSIYQEASRLPDLSNLVSLVNTYNLSGLLNNTQGPLTLLAPDNPAWSAVAGGNNSHGGNISFWQDVLMNHIFTGNLYSIITSTTIQSVNNKMWNVQQFGNQTLIGGSILVNPDVLACNGVIHVIDRVLGVTAI